MTEALRYGLVGLIVFLTHFQEGVTGFGCTVLALPFMALLLGLNTAVPVLVTLAWLLALCIVLESRKKIVWAEYAKIVFLAGIGLPAGIWAARVLPEDALKWVLSFFMIGVGAHGLARHYGKDCVRTRMSESTRRLTSSIIPLGGIIHGAFGSGGPLIVIYATRALPEKSLFRVTLCLVWLTLNSALIAQWALTSKLDAHTLKITAFCLPFTILGMLLGNVMHYRVNDLVFRRMVYTVLVLSGLALVWSNVD